MPPAAMIIGSRSLPDVWRENCQDALLPASTAASSRSRFGPVPGYDGALVTEPPGDRPVCLSGTRLDLRKQQQKEQEAASWVHFPSRRADRTNFCKTSRHKYKAEGETDERCHPVEPAEPGKIVEKAFDNRDHQERQRGNPGGLVSEENACGQQQDGEDCPSQRVGQILRQRCREIEGNRSPGRIEIGDFNIQQQKEQDYGPRRQ